MIKCGLCVQVQEMFKDNILIINLKPVEMILKNRFKMLSVGVTHD